MQKGGTNLVERVSARGIVISIHKIFDKKKDGENGAGYSYWRLTYQKGKRIRERAKTLELARARAKALIKELAGLAPDEPSPFSGEQVRTVRAAVETLAPLNIKISDAAHTLAEVHQILGGRGTIQEAARLFVKKAKREDLVNITFGELYKEFMATLATKGDAKHREYEHSFRYWQDCSQRLGAAADFFKTMQVADITTRDLEAFLNKIPVRRRTANGVIYTGKYTTARGRTRNNYKGAFCTLFSFARKMRYLPRGVDTEAENILKAGEKRTKKAGELKQKIYTAEEMQTILDSLPPKWLPLVALGAFAGIRTAEIHRLRWEDINWKAGHIEIEKDKTKVGRRRIIKFSEQLIAWLKPVAKDEGWIVPHYAHDSTLSMEFAKVRNLIPVRKPRNGCRDSYATYRLQELKDEAEVSLEMGTSPRKLHDNYLSLVDDDELAAWQKVLPKPKPTDKPKKSAGKKR